MSAEGSLESKDELALWRVVACIYKSIDSIIVTRPENEHSVDGTNQGKISSIKSDQCVES